MRKQTIMTEEKWVKIESPSWVASDMGSSWRIEGVVYFDVKYKNENQVEELLNQAKKIYENENYCKQWKANPEATVYWKIIEKNINFV